MKGFFTAILGILLLGSMVSCERKAPTVEHVDFDTLTVDTICPLFHSYEKPHCHLVIKMAKPVAKTPLETLQAVESFISILPKDGSFEADANGSVESMVNAYVRSYVMQYLSEGHDAIGQHESDLAETEAASTWMNYEENVVGDILYNADGILSYQVVAESYTGGAHGNKTVDNGVFDLNTLQQLSIANVFNDATLPDLHAALRNKLMTQNGYTTIDELAEIGQFTAPNEIVATDNFYVNEEGITWTYDPYEIAPYSVGVVQITLSWDEVLPFLMDDSSIKTLAHNFVSQS